MSVYFRGDIAWIRYAGPDGRIVRESTRQGDKRVAERIERERRREVAAGTWKPPSLRTDPRQTVATYAEAWLLRQEDRGLRSIRVETQKLRAHVLPLIGHRVFADLRPRDVVQLVERLKQRQSVKGEPLAPRTVRNAYAVFHRMCRDAVIDEVIAATPCVLPTRTLPGKEDRDPSWRATAVFSRAEVEALISDTRIDMDRRVFYALVFLTGQRVGEAAGRRWADYDTAARPLGRMLIATQYAGTRVKTGRPREMPVHPTLAAILAEWRMEGFEMFFFNRPRPSDFICPETDASYGHRKGEHRLSGTTWRRLQADLRTLGFRPRRTHDARRTLITIGRADGCDRDVLRACTHGERGDVFDGYTSWSWDVKCREISKINVRRLGASDVARLTRAGGE
jgi:integrase